MDPECTEKSFTGGVTEAYEKFHEKLDSFIYTTIACNWHQNYSETLQHCPLSKVKRYGYVFASYCSEEHKYPIIASKHYPERLSKFKSN
jgi:hypothetical protein